MGKGTGLRPYANKRDASEGPIVDFLRASGCSVYRMDKPCDLLVMHRGIVRLVEVKSGKGSRLTKSQRSFINERWPVRVIRDIEEARLALITWAPASPDQEKKREAA